MSAIKIKDLPSIPSVDPTDTIIIEKDNGDGTFTTYKGTISQLPSGGGSDPQPTISSVVYDDVNTKLVVTGQNVFPNSRIDVDGSAYLITEYVPGEAESQATIFISGGLVTGGYNVNVTNGNATEAAPFEVA